MDSRIFKRQERLSGLDWFRLSVLAPPEEQSETKGYIPWPLGQVAIGMIEKECPATDLAAQRKVLERRGNATGDVSGACCQGLTGRLCAPHA